MNGNLVDGTRLRRVRTLEDVFRGSHARLVTSLYAFTGDLAEAQDAVQEAFVRAVSRESRVCRRRAPRRTCARWPATSPAAAGQNAQAGRTSAPGAARQRRFEPSPDRVAVIQALNELPSAQREVVRAGWAQISTEGSAFTPVRTPLDR